VKDRYKMLSARRRRNQCKNRSVNSSCTWKAAIRNCSHDMQRTETENCWRHL